MRALARPFQETAEPIPVPWAGLDGYIRPRPGNLVLVQAAPGVGKSTFALLWALKAQTPTIIGSWDTDLRSQALRTVSHYTGHKTWDLEGQTDFILDELAKVQAPVRFVDLTMGVEQVQELVRAETEFFGETPGLIVADTLSDLLEDLESAQEYQRVMTELHRLARVTKSVVLVLHHPRRKPQKASDDDPKDPGTVPVRLQDGLYAVDRVPEIVLGVWKPRPDLFRVAILKNRMGQSDPNAGLYVDLEVDFARTAIEVSLSGALGVTAGPSVWAVPDHNEREAQ